MPERCICCGAVIPEGVQVCPVCAAKFIRRIDYVF